MSEAYKKVTIIIEDEEARQTFEFKTTNKVDLDVVYVSDELGRIYNPEVKSVVFSFKPYKDANGVFYTEVVENLFGKTVIDGHTISTERV